MKILKVYKKPVNIEDFDKRSAQESDYAELITESTILVDAETNKILVIYDELEHDFSDMVQALKNIKYHESKRLNGLKTRSRIFGYKPRVTMRSDFCTATSLAVDFPRENAIICKYAELLEKIYFKWDSDVYKKHKAIADEKLKPDYRINGTVFSSGIINKNNPLKYHFDAGNFKQVFSAMLVFKGGTEGGYLSLPEYGLGIELKNNSLLMFDGQGILHGVTPIKKVSPLGFRFSVVYYSLTKIWQCLTIDEELIRIRKVKTQREINRQKMTPEHRAKLQNFKNQQIKRK